MCECACKNHIASGSHCCGQISKLRAASHINISAESTHRRRHPRNPPGNPAVPIFRDRHLEHANEHELYRFLWPSGSVNPYVPATITSFPLSGQVWLKAEIFRKISARNGKSPQVIRASCQRSERVTRKVRLSFDLLLLKFQNYQPCFGLRCRAAEFDGSRQIGFQTPDRKKENFPCVDPSVIGKLHAMLQIHCSSKGSANELTI